jgi:ATP-dependent Clp protease ATP-binding subunit ClpB
MKRIRLTPLTKGGESNPSFGAVHQMPSLLPNFGNGRVIGCWFELPVQCRKAAAGKSYQQSGPSLQTFESLGGQIAITETGKDKTMRVTTLDPTKRSPAVESLELGLRSKIVGQDDAIHQVVEMYQTYLSGMSAPGRPIANLMFLGPTGSGKTRVVEALAECLLENPRAVLKIDCGEFQHSHEVAKLIGSPPGYLGHRDTSPVLTQEAVDRYQTPEVKMSIVLFDEIEKASDAVWNLMLGILDKATLTLGDNSKVDFSRTMVFMTSNVGAREMSALMKPRLGFTGSVEQTAVTTDMNEPWNDEIARSGVDAARRQFTPEFINRLDKLIVFRPLSGRQLDRILEIELNSIRGRVSNADAGRPFTFSVTPSAKQFLLKEGTNIEYGARHLKRTIERLVVQPLSRLMASGQILGGDFIQIDYGPQSCALTFSVMDEGVALPDTARWLASSAVSRAAFAAV